MNSRVKWRAQVLTTSLFLTHCTRSVKAIVSRRVSVVQSVSSGSQSQSSTNAQLQKMDSNRGARNASASIEEGDSVLTSIFLDITTGVGRSTVELSLNKQDVLTLYNEAFAGVCLICQGKLGDSAGDVCCKCLHLESRHHADCCLTEEGV